jgi:hypothetical protein
MAETVQGAVERNMQAMSEVHATADVDLTEKWCKNVMPIITQYAPKDIFIVDKTALFYSAQLKWTVALKGEKCQGGKGYKDIVMVLLCCNIDGSEGLLPFTVGNFEKLCCL